ncbi:primosome assembly protein PriA [Actinobaculum suis]|uniref:Primosome assembly protein PriA n=1 Tax=Actinobaculum suis TaxID=1657 RepID=A0A7Z9C8F3_9ACTO|nr:hypothetical protein [Actinobaculum suis]VDG76441.1 primosome assembly protein PriA [Actinobaculum suis]
MEEIAGFGEIPDFGEQGSLLDISRLAARIKSSVPDPVAHVRPLVTHPQLDHVFDYLVPQKFAAQAQVGCRVVVDIGSRRVNGFIVARDADSRAGTDLKEIRRVVSAVPVLTPEIYELAREVADRWACSVAEVLRLAIPERHARAEKEFFAADTPLAEPGLRLEPQTWENYAGGVAFATCLAEGKSPHAIVATLPGEAGGRNLLAEAVASTRQSGRGVLVVVPNTRLARSLARYLEKTLGEKIAFAAAEDPHETRYRNFLGALAGRAGIVVGSRAATWWPVKKLGLAVVIDDAATSLREPRAPYAEASEVLRLRARLEEAAFLAYGPYVSERSAQAIREGALLLEGETRAKKQILPQVSAAEQWNTDDSFRIPSPAFQLVRQALPRGPVLFTVPRSGYIPEVACGNCWEPARCAECGGKLAIPSKGERPHCTRCGTRINQWRCAQCGYGHLRAMKIGSYRTAEEIGRAFPGVGMILSGAGLPEGIIPEVDGKSRIVVATPGAEPRAAGGYAAAVVLDSRYLLGEGLDADTRFIRAIARVISRVRSAEAGGKVMLAGRAELQLVSALARWAHGERAEISLAERSQLKLPPAWRWLAVTGRRRDIRNFLGILRAALRSHPLPNPQITGATATTAGGTAAGTTNPGATQINPDTTAATASITQTNASGSSSDPSALSSDASATTSEASATTSDASTSPSLLVGGVHHLVPGVEILGPVPARQPEEMTVYLRTELASARHVMAQARRSYGSYAGGSSGMPLRLEVDPPM